MSDSNRRWYDGMVSTEDWWSVWLGLALFAAGFASIWGWDLVGWMVEPGTWAIGGPGHWLKMTGYADWPPLAGLVVTYLVFTVLVGLGAAAMRFDLRRFFAAWTALFALTWVLWIVGHEAHFAATVNKFDQYGIGWGLSFGGGFSYILAVVVGLVLANFCKPVARFLREAARPEWFIKVAIVFMGVKIGLKSMQAASSVFELALASAAAAFVVYLLIWPVMYWAGRRLFKLPRDAAAVLSSGISICGVSAAIATGGAIRARPTLPAAVAMLIVVFAVFELLILPGFYAAFFPHEPIVNGAALGMTVKTDGADAAAGGILNQLMVADAANRGLDWSGGWILNAAIMTKLWIDIFIGVWAFILAVLWTRHVEGGAREAAVSKSEIWFRFPKFILAYIVAWFAYLAIATLAPALIGAASQGAEIVEGAMRHFFFMLTFVSLGLITDFSKLRGMGRLAVFYGAGLIVFIAPLAYAVAWLFHHGMTPAALRVAGG
ncbi:putative sulfate exporter family transporter [Salinisphaera sp.]|uniref:putative sulfate exporter family transporter n=1 Tax=Salinisphaera sp. TaxID=1914330 RepID=UPI002D77EAD1|nr:putative sulfate exporter family transporter [Salinisphaera sp.]HET7314397.1 putative sulfate exporter family transporter [Salinisphaera sp.]